MILVVHLGPDSPHLHLQKIIYLHEPCRLEQSGVSFPFLRLKESHQVLCKKGTISTWISYSLETEGSFKLGYVTTSEMFISLPTQR